MESEQLLNPQFSKESDPNNENIPLHRQRKRGMYSSMLWSYVVCLHIFVFLAFTLMGISYGVLRSTQIPAISVWSMMNASFHHQYWLNPGPLSVGTRVSNEHSVDHKKYSKFSGPPNHQNTKAWEDLIQRISTQTPHVESHVTDHEISDVLWGDRARAASRWWVCGWCSATSRHRRIPCCSRCLSWAALSCKSSCRHLVGVPLNEITQRQLRLHLYRDTYFPNVTEANLNWFYGHLGKPSVLV